MQLKEEKAPIAPEEKKTMTTKSLDVRNQGPTTFQWPQNANVLESARPTTSTVLSSTLEDKLKDLGIFRSGGGDSEGSKSQVEGAARRCGLEKNNNVKEKKTPSWPRVDLDLRATR